MTMARTKVVLYNLQAVFYTMPLALLAVGSALDPREYDVRIVDGRLEQDPAAAVLAEIDDALCLGMTVLTGAPIRDALQVARVAKARRADLPVIWGGWHLSLFPTETLAEPAIDVTVQGQGIERFKFYNRFAWGPKTPLRRPLRVVARWRCRRDFYAAPVEKLVVDRLKPMPKLS